MDPERREVWLLIREAVQRVDGVFGSVWREIDRIIRQLPDRPLTKADHRILRRRIDTVLNRAFGLTQAAAPRSALYRAILQSTDAAAEAPFLTMFRHVERIVTEVDPVLWQQLRSMLLTPPMRKRDRVAGAIVNRLSGLAMLPIAIVAPMALRVGFGPLEDDEFTRRFLKKYPDADDAFAQAYRSIFGPDADKQRFLRSGLLDPQRKWVPKPKWNTQRGYRLSDRVWKQSRYTRTTINTMIRESVRNGDNPVVLAKRLERYLNPAEAPTRYLRGGRIVERGVTRKPDIYGYGSSRARTLARTEVSRIHAEATKRAALASPGVDGITWNLSGSHGRSDECDDKASGSSPGFDAGTYFVEDFPRMPSHPNCFPAGVRVDGPPIEKSYERWYDGDMVHIRTALGYDLSVTPNHPVLTPEGWVAAGRLNSGSDIISSGLSQWKFSLHEPDNNDVPPLIEQVAVSVGRSSFVRSVSMPTAAEYFHGDGVSSDVHVIRTNGELRGDVDPSISHPALHQHFRRRDMELKFLASEGASTLGFERLGRTSPSVIRSGSNSLALIGSQVSEPNFTRFGLRAERDPAINQSSFDCCSRYPEVFSNRLLSPAMLVQSAYFFLRKIKHELTTIIGDDRVCEYGRSADFADVDFSSEPLRRDIECLASSGNGQSVDISFDRVVEVSVNPFRGHVYNLQTSEGWYIANGIIVHNCLCFSTQHTIPRDEMIDALVEKYGLEAV